jgi:hypothetical protein
MLLGLCWQPASCRSLLSPEAVITPPIIAQWAVQHTVPYTLCWPLVLIHPAAAAAAAVPRCVHLTSEGNVPPAPKAPGRFGGGYGGQRDGAILCGTSDRRCGHS